MKTKTTLKHPGLLWILFFLLLTTTVHAQTRSFGIGDKTFLLNGKPFLIKAALAHSSSMRTSG